MIEIVSKFSLVLATAAALVSAAMVLFLRTNDRRGTRSVGKERTEDDPSEELLKEKTRTDRRLQSLSAVTGATLGSSLIVFASNLNFDEPTRLLLTASAPWLAVAIARLAPLISEYVRWRVRLLALNRAIRQIENLLADMPEGSSQSAAAKWQLLEMRRLVADALASSALTSLWK